MSEGLISLKGLLAACVEEILPVKQVFRQQPPTDMNLAKWSLHP